MPPAPEKAPVALVCGDDDFSVKQRARALHAQWCAEVGGMDHETLDASVTTSDDALRVLGRLREALNTLPFFGGGKVVWLKDCTFLGEDRTSSGQAVLDALAEMAAELKTFKWQGVRLIVSAGKVDRRRTFFKTLNSLGDVEEFAALSADDKDWVAKAEDAALRVFRAEKKSIEDQALGELVANVGPNLRQLNNEITKLCLYTADRTEVTSADVQAVVTRNKQARAFALGDAVGDRDLPKVLRCLEDELWSMRTDKERSEIGLVLGLVSKVRAMLLIQELLREKLVRPSRDYRAFTTELARVPDERVPADRRYNPKAITPFVLFRAAQQQQNYTGAELVKALDLLADCARQLVSSGVDEAALVQQTLVRIVQRSDVAGGGVQPGRRRP